MEERELFPVANLSQDDLSRLVQAEESLREKTGEEIVLIAYKHEQSK
ncbi:hypothetical protein LRR81_18215 [Metabacillus sp. GX 13764]|nr:hypothetical protein [Metabacillus kandeliae]MCD7036181.1 hypothetical protein [Metabacillus kandeliae]